MARPKGSKNKKETVIINFEEPPSVTMTLTEQDLIPVRQRQAAHARAEAEFKRQFTQNEMMQQRLGEITELSVPQVVPFSLSDAYHAAALTKAKAAGFAGITNLRKEAAGWTFEALTAEGWRAVLAQRARDNEGAQAAANARLEQRLNEAAH